MHNFYCFVYAKFSSGYRMGIVVKFKLHCQEVEFAADAQGDEYKICTSIKMLQECGTVDVEFIGRGRYCKVKAGSLVPAFLWLEQYQKDRI